MPKKPLEAIEGHFSKVPNPRKDRTKDHKLIDIIAIAICAIICGAEGWHGFRWVQRIPTLAAHLTDHC